MANGKTIHLHQELVERCKHGDAAAYRQLYDLYAKAMFNASLRLVNDQEEAEDVLQDAFMSAFQHLHQFKGTVSFGSWLKRIVINKSIDALKRKKGEPVPLTHEDYLSAAEEIEPDEFPVYSVEKIRQCVQLLPDGYRTILSLYLFEHYSHKEIAQLLNINEGTSKSQYSRARKKLIEFMHKNN